jgi:type 1 glutamine amidotransferase
MRALIASGTGRYADPWHPFSSTTPRLADLLRAADFDVSVDEDVDHALSDLSGVDLLVVNAGDPWRSDAEPAPAPPGDALEAAVEAGLGILALHCAVASLRDYALWASLIGAVWLPTVSYHPPQGDTTVTGLKMPDGKLVPDFDLFDERYCRLQQIGPRQVVAEHPGDHFPEPAAWVRHHGRSRIAVDVLGHDERSYDPPGHRDLIQHLARWAVRAS